MFNIKKKVISRFELVIVIDRRTMEICLRQVSHFYMQRIFNGQQKKSKLHNDGIRQYFFLKDEKKLAIRNFESTLSS